MTAEKSKAADATAAADEKTIAAEEPVVEKKAAKKPAAKKKTAAKKAPAKKAPVKKAAPKKATEKETVKKAPETSADAETPQKKPAEKKKAAAAPKKKTAKRTKKQRLKITQVKSQIGYARAQRKVLTGLGLGRIGRSVVRVDHPSIRGMVAKVSHLVSVEEVEA